MAHPEPILERDPIQGERDPGKPRILLAASGSVAAIKFGIICHSFSNWAEVRAVATKSSLHFIDRASLPRDMILYTDEDEWSSWKKIGDSVLHIELRKWADVMVVAPLSANTLGKEIYAIMETQFEKRFKILGFNSREKYLSNDFQRFLEENIVMHQRLWSYMLQQNVVAEWKMQHLMETTNALFIYSKIAGGLCDNLLTCVVRAWDFNKPLFVAPAMNTFMWNNPFTERHLVTISELGVLLVPPITKKLACGDYGNGAMAEPSLIHNTVMLSFNHRAASSSTCR